MEQRDHPQYDDYGQRGQLGEHEGVLQAGGDPHAPAVEPGEEGDAEGGDELEGGVRDLAGGEDGLEEVVGHSQGHDGVRSRAVSTSGERIIIICFTSLNPSTKM